MTPIARVRCWTFRQLSAFLAVAFIAGFAVGSVFPNGLRVMWSMPVAVPSIAYKAGEHLCEHWGKLAYLVPRGESLYDYQCVRHARYNDVRIHTKAEGK